MSWAVGTSLMILVVPVVLDIMRDQEVIYQAESALPRFFVSLSSFLARALASSCRPSASALAGSASVRHCLVQLLRKQKERASGV